MTALSIFIALHLSLIIIRAIYRKICLRDLDVRLFFSEATAVEGDSLTLSTVLTNAKWLPLPWVAVKFQVSKFLRFADMENAQISDDYYRNDLYNVLMYQRIIRRLEFLCTKRGYYRFKSLDITCWDILIDRKYVNHFDCDASLTVYPSTLEVQEIDELHTRINGHLQAQRFIHPDPFTFRGIREYAPNDPVKAINFKASAKSQDLMVNLWDYSVSRQVVLMFNLQRQSRWHNEILDERAIKVAASLAQRLTEAHIPVRFITNGTGIVSSKGVDLPEGTGATHFNQIMEALAHINLDQTPDTPFANIMEQAFTLYQQEPEYWLISTYHEADIEAAYHRLGSLGAKTAWIVPHSHQVDIDERFINRNKLILVE
ncbi:MAG: DUF58 domain-containing protein [Defluviitaleaceae bacterium]|nr:DUF58 domain-containing protein [Defluviitaleaceae bacterium]